MSARDTEAAKARFKVFIDEAIAAHPTEARLIRRLWWKAAKEGNPVVSTWDHEEAVEVKSLRELQEVVFNLDEVYIYLKSGAWVYFIMGEGEDAVCDYTTDIEPIIDYVTK